MKKALLVLLSLGLFSCEPDPAPCNPECWKITDLKVSEFTGSLKITFTNPCRKTTSYVIYTNDDNNYHLYNVGDFICQNEFPSDAIGNPPPSI